MILNVSFLGHKIGCLFAKDKNEYVNNFYRRQGMEIGSDTHIFTQLRSLEPYLIKIGNHVTISTDVKLVTHDASIGALKGRNIASDICGEINIGNHTFIGIGAMILYGVTIGDYCIIAAGSVVTKSVPDGEVWGGNPAHKLGNSEDFLEKNKSYGLQLHGLNAGERKKKILNGAIKRK